MKVFVLIMTDRLTRSEKRHIVSEVAAARVMLAAAINRYTDDDWRFSLHSGEIAVTAANLLAAMNGVYHVDSHKTLLARATRNKAETFLKQGKFK